MPVFSTRIWLIHVTSSSHRCSPLQVLQTWFCSKSGDSVKQFIFLMSNFSPFVFVSSASTIEISSIADQQRKPFENDQRVGRLGKHCSDSRTAWCHVPGRSLRRRRRDRKRKRGQRQAAKTLLATGSRMPHGAPLTENETCRSAPAISADSEDCVGILH